MNIQLSVDELEVLIRLMIRADEQCIDVKAVLSCLEVNKSFATATLSVLNKFPDFAISVLSGAGLAATLTVRERASAIDDVLTYTKFGYDHPYDDVAQTA